MTEKNFNYESNVEALRSTLKDYEQGKEEKSGKQKREEILAKIYNPRKNKEIFRILPPQKGYKFYEEAYFHYLQTTVTGGKKKWTKIYCPRRNEPMVPKLDENDNEIKTENGEVIKVPAPCPLCEKHDRIMAQQDNSVRYKKREELNPAQQKIFDNNKDIFKNAKEFEPRKFYIVKGIDRWNEGDGPKFWRFKDSFTNRGTMDKLKSVLEEYLEVHNKDFMSPVEGTDLSIIMTDAKNPAGFVYKDISAITPRGPSPLHSEEHIARSWLQDKSTWRDAFKPKKAPNITPYQYLQLVADGNNPYYDEVQKKWIFPNNPELEKMANTKNNDLSDSSYNKKFDQASDLSDSIEDDVKIDDVNKTNVGEYDDGSVSMKEEVAKDKQDFSSETSEEKKSENKVNDSGDSGFNYDDIIDDDDDDLPF